MLPLLLLVCGFCDVSVTGVWPLPFVMYMCRYRARVTTPERQQMRYTGNKVRQHKGHTPAVEGARTKAIHQKQRGRAQNHAVWSRRVGPGYVCRRLCRVVYVRKFMLPSGSFECRYLCVTKTRVTKMSKDNE